MAKAAQKNWFGVLAHPSDSLIHWSSVKHPGDRGYREFVTEVAQLRRTWDFLARTPARKKALTTLLQAQHDITRADERCDQCGG